MKTEPEDLHSLSLPLTVHNTYTYTCQTILLLSIPETDACYQSSPGNAYMPEGMTQERHFWEMPNTSGLQPVNAGEQWHGTQQPGTEFDRRSGLTCFC